jgi:hypothetical protein
MLGDDSQLDNLLANGYLIVGPVMFLSELTENSIANFLSVFSVSLSPQTLLDPSNRNRTLIMLRHPSTGHQIEIISSDDHVITRAKGQRSYQEEPIGLLIRALCSALGGRSSRERIFHLDQLIPSLNGLWNWQFNLGERVGTFEASKRLETTDRGSAEEVLDKLNHLLDFLAYLYQVGFYIQHLSISQIPRLEPTVSVGPEERMLTAVTKEDIHDIEVVLSSPKAIVAVRGLNQSYIENCMPSRLSMLWAAAEHVFSNKPERLLSNDEITSLFKAAEIIESLRKDPQRLGDLKKALQDPDRLPLKSRNLRMAEAIAPVMNITTEVAYTKVRTASKLRGKNVHRLSQDWKDIEDSEKFLQEALLRYIAKCKVPEKED